MNELVKKLPNWQMRYDAIRKLVRHYGWKGQEAVELFLGDFETKTPMLLALNYHKSTKLRAALLHLALRIKIWFDRSRMKNPAFFRPKNFIDYPTPETLWTLIMSGPAQKGRVERAIRKIFFDKNASDNYNKTFHMLTEWVRQMAIQEDANEKIRSSRDFHLNELARLRETFGRVKALSLLQAGMMSDKGMQICPEPERLFVVRMYDCEVFGSATNLSSLRDCFTLIIRTTAMQTVPDGNPFGDTFRHWITNLLEKAYELSPGLIAPVLETVRVLPPLVVAPEMYIRALNWGSPYGELITRLNTTIPFSGISKYQDHLGLLLASMVVKHHERKTASLYVDTIPLECRSYYEKVVQCSASMVMCLGKVATSELILPHLKASLERWVMHYLKYPDVRENDALADSMATDVNGDYDMFVALAKIVRTTLPYAVSAVFVKKCKTAVWARQVVSGNYLTPDGQRIAEQLEKL